MEPPSKRQRLGGVGIADNIMSRLDYFATSSSSSPPPTATPRHVPMTELNPGQRVIRVVEEAELNQWRAAEPQQHGFLVNPQGQIVDRNGAKVTGPVLQHNADYVDVTFSRAEMLEKNPDYATFSMVAGKLNRQLSDFWLPNNEQQIDRIEMQVRKTLDDERQKRRISLEQRRDILQGLAGQYKNLETQVNVIKSVNDAFAPTAARWSWLGSMTGYAMVGKEAPANVGTWLGSKEPLPYWLLSTKLRPAYSALLQNPLQLRDFFETYLAQDDQFWSMGTTGWFRALYDAVKGANRVMKTDAQLQLVYGMYVLLRDFYGTVCLPLLPDTNLTKGASAKKVGSTLDSTIANIHLAFNANLRTRKTGSSAHNDNELNPLNEGATPSISMKKELLMKSEALSTLTALTKEISSEEEIKELHWWKVMKDSLADPDDTTMPLFRRLFAWSLSLQQPMPMPINALTAWLHHFFIQSGKVKVDNIDGQLSALIQKARHPEETSKIYSLRSYNGKLVIEVTFHGSEKVAKSEFEAWLLFGSVLGTNGVIDRFIISNLRYETNSEDEQLLNFIFDLNVINYDDTHTSLATIELLVPNAEHMEEVLAEIGQLKKKDAAIPRFYLISGLVNYIVWSSLFERVPSLILTLFDNSTGSASLVEAFTSVLHQGKAALDELDLISLPDASTLKDVAINLQFGAFEFVRELIRSTFDSSRLVKKNLIPSSKESSVKTVQDPHVPLILPSLEALYQGNGFLNTLTFKLDTSEGNQELLRLDAGLIYRSVNAKIAKAISLYIPADQVNAFNSLDRLEFNLYPMDHSKLSPSFKIYFDQRLLEVSRHLDDAASLRKAFQCDRESNAESLQYLNLLLAMSIFSGDVYPSILKKTMDSLEVHRNSMLKAEENYAKLVDDDFSVAVGNIQDLITKLSNPQLSYQMNALISGRITIPEMFAAAGQETIVGIHENVPSLRGVPYDVLVRNVDAGAKGRTAYIDESQSDPDAVLGLWTAFWRLIACNATLIQRTHPRNYMTKAQQDQARIDHIHACNAMKKYRAEPLAHPIKGVIQPWRVLYNR